MFLNRLFLCRGSTTTAVKKAVTNCCQIATYLIAYDNKAINRHMYIYNMISMHQSASSLSAERNCFISISLSQGTLYSRRTDILQSGLRSSQYNFSKITSV